METVVVLSPLKQVLNHKYEDCKQNVIWDVNAICFVKSIFAVVQSGTPKVIRYNKLANAYVQRPTNNFLLLGRLR